MNVINASAWSRQVNSSETFIRYSSGNCFPIVDSVDSIDTALKPTTWATNYHAFAELIIDTQTEELVLIRDHWGCEPFYYFIDGQRLIFGSNLPDILRHLPQSPTANTAQLLALFSFSQQYTDETFYQSIYRVEPGHILYLKKGGAVRKIPFWHLDKSAEDLRFAKEEEYLEKFSELIHNAVRFHTQEPQFLGAEFSGGLDSSAIHATAHQQGLSYPLFMHTAPPGSKSVDDRVLGEDLMRHLNLTDVQFVNADNFDPPAVLEFCAQAFAGVAPYIFFMLANNVHQAVVKRGCKILLSGAGGDECVSSHAAPRYLIPQLLHKRDFRRAWHELNSDYLVRGLTLPSTIRRAEQLLKSAHPFAYHFLSKLENTARSIKQYFQQQEHERNVKPYFRSVRDHEWHVLQGPGSHETRMRVEYSAVIAKTMGFEYRYPLLYPKLVDFCFRLPAHQKRQNGVGRYLMRRYLENHIPASVYTKQSKAGGIVPATLEKCYQSLEKKPFYRDVSHLPANKTNNAHTRLATQIHAYMMQYMMGIRNQ